MFIQKSWFSFYRDESPDWQCPTCGNASLNLVPEEFHCHESSETKKTKDCDEFDADWVRYRFSAVLRCSNIRCNEVVTMIGSGEVETEHFHDQDKQWETNYRDCFKPYFFEPCLKPIAVPKNAPRDVRKSLHQAFALIFSNYGAAANQIRVAVEALLNFHDVPSIENNKRIYLGERIQKHLTPPLQAYKPMLSAVRWIGNAGSHESNSIKIEDLLDGLYLIETVLANLYPDSVKDVEELAASINKNKKPRSQH